jgi:hypothetical protein
MRKALERCPACHGQLDVTRQSCRECDTVVEGSFESCLFCRLSPEGLHFAVTFVKNRGNLKEMERELGLSYPTLRSRLNALLLELGFEADTGADEPEGEMSGQRRAVLELLDSGEINAVEAAERLSRLR